MGSRVGVDSQCHATDRSVLLLLSVLVSGSFKRLVVRMTNCLNRRKYEPNWLNVKGHNTTLRGMQMPRQSARTSANFSAFVLAGNKQRGPLRPPRVGNFTSLSDGFNCDRETYDKIHHRSV